MISEYKLSQIYLGDKFRHFVGQVPPNRDLPVQPHFPLREGPNAVYCYASRRFLQLGKVRCARYPGSVGGNNLVCSGCLSALVLVWDRFCFATTVVIGCHEVTSGPPMTDPKGELVGVAGRLSRQ